MKINIFGASGSGTTTLGKNLSTYLNCEHLDADDYYWKKTSPPFQLKVPLEERNSNIIGDFEAERSVILSGSMMTWGEYWKSAFDLAVFLLIPPKIRMKRLEKRESKRYGKLLKTDKTTILNSKTFMEWAAKYDDPDFDGRSITQHSNWIKLLKCPVVRIERDYSTEEQINHLLPIILRDSD